MKELLVTALTLHNSHQFYFPLKELLMKALRNLCQHLWDMLACHLLASLASNVIEKLFDTYRLLLSFP